MSALVGAVIGAAVGLVASPVLASWARAVETPAEPPRRRVQGPPGWWRPRRTGPGRLVLTVVLAVLAGLCAGSASHGGASLPAWLVLALAMVVLAQVDARCHRLPDAVLLPALALGAMLLLVAAAVQGRPGRWLGCLVAAAVVGAVFLGLALLSPASFGLGDVKLMVLLALFLAWNGIGSVLGGLIAGFVLAAATALVLLATRRARWRTAIAFGPPLMAGALLVAAVS